MGTLDRTGKDRVTAGEYGVSPEGGVNLPGLQDELVRTLTALGAALVGFADLRGLPADIRQDLPYGVSIAVALQPEIVQAIVSGPTREYQQEYQRVNTHLASLTGRACDLLRDAGFRAVTARPTLSTAELGEDLSTPLPHKTVATRAGLGWIGRCALLVTEEFGSAIRLGTVLTDAPLVPGKPQNSSKCGSCGICVEACPAKAPTGREWAVGVSRGEYFNAARCHGMARELTDQCGIEEIICGICIANCPWTRRYLDRRQGQPLQE